MIEFVIKKKSKHSLARLGILKTPHGIVETPSLVPVATRATVKGLTSQQVEQTKTQILIANTFHLHLRPGGATVKSAGGLHDFMQWPHPLMTDSGGFQVFSLGFGQDLRVGKIFKYFPGQHTDRTIEVTAQPKQATIGSDGVTFRSPLDGNELFIGPKESIRIQEQLGADIIFAFDECTPPLSSREYVAAALDRTHRWAKTCVEVKRSKQALFGIVQGSRFKEMRLKSTAYINSLDFDGYGIGGDLGRNKRETANILSWVVPNLNQNKPRHLLGIGRLEDMELIIKRGIDLFDCTVPTQYARRGQAFTRSGKINFRQSRYLKDSKAIDPRCGCAVCQTYDRRYVAHLVRASEMTGLQLITFHNLFYFNSVVEDLRKKIQAGKI